MLQYHHLLFHELSFLELSFPVVESLVLDVCHYSFVDTFKLTYTISIYLTSVLYTKKKEKPHMRTHWLIAMRHHNSLN